MDNQAKNQVVTELQWPQKHFVIKRETIAFDKLTDFFSTTYGSLYGALAKQGTQVNEAPYALYFNIDEAKGVTDVAAAVAVEKPTKLEGFELFTMQPSKLVTAVHIGPYEKMIETYKMMDNYLAEHKLKRSLVLEQYLSDPEIEKDPSQWKTIVFLVVG